MTVPVQTIVNSYTSAGTSTFVYGFQILDASHLVVTVNGITKTQNVDYAVTGVGVQAGGTITGLTTVNGDKVILRRLVPLQRLTDYQNNGDLLAQTLNPDFDLTWQALQQVDEKTGRALSLPIGTSVSATLPTPVGGTFLGWSALGDAIQNYAGVATSAVSVFMATVMTAVDAAAARLALGAAKSGLATGSGLTQSTATMLGRITAATGAIEELTPAQVAAFTASATTSAQGVSELATTAETQTGSDTTRTVTPAGLKGALLFSKSFLSADQTVTANSVLNVAHGLAVKPVFVRLSLKCTTTELNYAVNDEIEYNQFTYSGVGYVQTVSDATNVTIIITGANVGVMNKSTQTMTSITTANWRWVVRAWA